MGVRALLTVVVISTILAVTTSAAPLKRVEDVVIDSNFKNVNNELSNTVHRTGTETIQGSKTFAGTVVFSTVTMSSATITSLNITGLLRGTTAIFTGNITATSGTYSGALSATTLDTGQGANDLYDMNQNVQTSDTVQFAAISVNTGTIPSGSIVAINGKTYLINNASNGQLLFSTSSVITGGKWTIGTINTSAHFILIDLINDRSVFTSYGNTTNRRIELWATGADAGDVELEVSDNSTTGGGTVHAAIFAAHSEKRLKNNIVYKTPEEEDEALEHIKLLDVANWRYLKTESSTSARLVDNPGGAIHTGVIWDDAPPEIKKPDGTISLNDQIAMLQMALKAALRRIETLESR